MREEDHEMTGVLLQTACVFANGNVFIFSDPVESRQDKLSHPADAATPGNGDNDRSVTPTVLLPSGLPDDIHNLRINHSTLRPTTPRPETTTWADRASFTAPYSTIIRDESTMLTSRTDHTTPTSRLLK